jgi:hypothetical protein
MTMFRLTCDELGPGISLRSLNMNRLVCRPCSHRLLCYEISLRAAAAMDPSRLTQGQKRHGIPG